MKPSNKDITQNPIEDQSGQTFVEFILLLASVVMVAYSFMRLTNGNIAEKWTAMAQFVLDDESQVLEPR